ncbi:MAG: NAD(P)-dependent oxidoreductase [Pseudomonadota bacterium]
MKTFPMFLKVAERCIVIIGGGEQAAQKARLALKTEAKLVVIAAELDPELKDLVDSGRVRHLPEADAQVFADSALVFVATGCKGADASWHWRAKAAGALVNVVDYPDLCDAMTPSIVDRDPVVVAIGTEGTAPLLGRRIKTQIEELLHGRLGEYAAMAGRLRAEVAQRIPAKGRREFWRWVFNGAPWSMFSSGRERAAVGMIKDAMREGVQGVRGHLCVVLGASAAGLIPMSAVQRLQEADVIFVERNVPNAVLEFARRDAERVFLNATAPGEPFCGDTAEVCRKAAQSQKVVFLGQATDPWSVWSWKDLEIPVEQLVCAQTVSVSSPANMQAGMNG